MSMQCRKTLKYCKLVWSCVCIKPSCSIRWSSHIDICWTCLLLISITSLSRYDNLLFYCLHRLHSSPMILQTNVLNVNLPTLTFQIKLHLLDDRWTGDRETCNPIGARSTGSGQEARGATIHRCRSIHRLMGERSNCIDATPEHRCISLYYTLLFWQSHRAGVCETISVRVSQAAHLSVHRLNEPSGDSERPCEREVV